ncbi:MAG: SIS domain-containing protein [Caldisericaceae bacterium]|nr:SIS domain-containing protein [Caldisericaceae bacterium]
MNELLLKEIKEQPVVINKFLNDQADYVNEICSKLIGQYDYILIAARGTSDNAARYAKYIFGSLNKVQVALSTPSLFTIYKNPPILKRALVIGVSQSGQSPDIVSVLKSANEQNRPTISITNDESSPLAKVSDFVINLGVGDEKAVAATKTYTASLTALALFSCYLNNEKNQLKELLALPSKIAKTLDSALERVETSNRYRYMEQCVVIGRGFNYATAFEISLKIKELARVIAVPYSSADFKHGPIATLNRGFPVIIVAPSGIMYKHILAFTKKILNLGVELIVISDNEEILNLGKTAFSLCPDVPEWLSPITSVIPGQLFARKLAIDKGFDSDNPEGLTKITETY